LGGSVLTSYSGVLGSEASQRVLAWGEGRRRNEDLILHELLSLNPGAQGLKTRYGDHAEWFLRDLERVLKIGREGSRGEEEHVIGDGDGDVNVDDDQKFTDDDNDDDDQHQARTERNLKLSRTISPTFVVAYQPQLTQPLWETVEKDGHLELLPPEITVDVRRDGDAVDVGDAWFITVYYYISLSLLGILVLAYSLVFTSISLNSIS
jgi:hypothetical protein